MERLSLGWISCLEWIQSRKQTDFPTMLTTNTKNLNLAARVTLNIAHDNEQRRALAPRNGWTTAYNVASKAPFRLKGSCKNAIDARWSRTEPLQYAITVGLVNWVCCPGTVHIFRVASHPPNEFGWIHIRFDVSRDGRRGVMALNMFIPPHYWPTECGISGKPRAKTLVQLYHMTVGFILHCDSVRKNGDSCRQVLGGYRALAWLHWRGLWLVLQVVPKARCCDSGSLLNARLKIVLIPLVLAEACGCQGSGAWACWLPERVWGVGYLWLASNNDSAASGQHQKRISWAAPLTFSGTSV